MSQYIATHDANGQAIFSKEVPSENNVIQVPNGSVSLIASTYEFPPNDASNEGVSKYAQDRINFFPPPGIVPPGGTSTLMFTMDAGGISPMHRTLTHDIVVIMEGVVELHVDSGEQRTLYAGDCVTMRATMHKWVNVTPNNGILRMVCFVQDIPEPLKIGDKVLDVDFSTWKDT